MRQRIIAIGVLSVAAAAGCGIAFAQANATESGVAGKISLSPACPGPQRIDQGPCTAPFAGARVALRNRAGATVGSAVAGPDGGFKLPAAAGAYQIHVDVDGAYPRCETVRVTVRKGRLAEVAIHCDSGMR